MNCTQHSVGEVQQLSVLRRQLCHDYIKWQNDNIETSNKTLSLLNLILLSGDIHQNPEPIKYPCAICNKPVAKNQHALQCDECDAWVHTKCDGISKEDYKRFETINSLVFECPSCRLLTFTDSFFISDHEQSYESTNSFHMLTESDTSAEDSAENITNLPNYHSSTKNPGKIRILTVNCRSLMSDKKRIDLHNLIETHKPNIIIGTESHLDSTIVAVRSFQTTFKTHIEKIGNQEKAEITTT